MTVSSDVLRRTLSTAPWAGRYPAAVALALLALCPFLVLTTAAVLFQRDLATALGTTEFGVQLTAGLSNAFYAFGAVAAADLIQRMPGRRLFVGCEALFGWGSTGSASRSRLRRRCCRSSACPG